MIAIPLQANLYRDLVGKPFQAGARGPDAYDCLGLVLEITRRRGISVPEYASTPEELARQYDEGGGLLGPCYRIERPDVGAIVLMRSSSPSRRHLGLMLDRVRLIHASEVAGQVVIEPLPRSLWQRRVLGYYFPDPRPAPRPETRP